MDRFLLLSLALATFLPSVVAQEALTQRPGLAYRFEIPATDDGLPGAGPIRRYDWMKQVWDERRSTFADRSPKDHSAIVFFGDSITQSWTDDFGGDFDSLAQAGFKVANRGISGDTTRGMLIRMDEDVIDLDPTAVVLLMGTNDLEEKASTPTIVSNVGLILDRLKDHDPSMPIVLCLVMPSSAKKSRPKRIIEELNNGLRELVQGNDQVTMVDTWTLFAGDDGDAKREEFPDLLHPNRIGYAKWKSALMPIFESLGYTGKKRSNTTVDSK